MSENPYAPPDADLAAAPGERLEGTGTFDVGQCLSEAWHHTWANFPLWLGAGLVGLLAVVLSAATVVGIVLLVPILYWGGVYFGLRMHDGGAELADVFAGFQRYGRALVGMLVIGAVTFLIGLAGQSVSLVGDALGNDLLQVVGLPIYLFVALGISPRLTFAYFLLVDRDEDPGAALRESWRMTGPVKWKVVGLVLLSTVVGLAGLLVLLVGIVPAMVICLLMWTSAYRQMVGGPAAGPAGVG